VNSPFLRFVAILGFQSGCLYTIVAQTRSRMKIDDYAAIRSLVLLASDKVACSTEQGPLLAMHGRAYTSLPQIVNCFSRGVAASTMDLVSLGISKNSPKTHHEVERSAG